MDIKKPVLEITKETTLPDGSEALIIGKSYEEPMFDKGDVVHNMIEIVRKKDNKTCGLAFFRDQMDEKELQDKIDDIAENPDSIKI